jgi:hypothetical protein
MADFRNSYFVVYVCVLVHPTDRQPGEDLYYTLGVTGIYRRSYTMVAAFASTGFCSETVISTASA